MDLTPLALDDAPAPKIRLRGRQQEWLDKIRADLKTYSRCLVVAPGGVGKTTLFAALAADLWREYNIRTLVLENRDRLTEQTAERIRTETGLDVDVEKAEQRASPYAPIVVACVQSLSKRSRLEGFPDNHFGLVVVDECHLALSESWLRIIRYHHWGRASLEDGWVQPADGSYKPLCAVVGFTASPDLGDRKNLGELFHHQSVNYSFLDAIEEGWLVGIKEINVPVKIDVRRFHRRKTAEGAAFDVKDQNAAIIPIIKELAEQYVAYASDRKGIIFVPSVEIARQMSDVLSGMGLKSWFVSGECIDKNEKTDDFAASGPGSVLVNCSIYVFGVDFPDVDCVAIFGPMLSKVKYCLDEKTEILSERGWVSDVSPGELVAAFDINTGAIKYVPALASIRRPLAPGEKFLSIKTRSADIRVTDNHRMIHDNKKRLGWRFAPAHRLWELRDPQFIPVSGMNERQTGVPLTDDELRFIGWVMTDGCINKQNNQITITQGEHQPWLEKIEECIRGCGFKFTRTAKHRQSQFRSSSRVVLWTISHGMPQKKQDRHLSGWARLMPWLDKNFSPLLMRVSPRQFDVLIDAINLGDGCKFKTVKHYRVGTMKIASGRKIFCDRLQEVAVGCGYRCAIFDRVSAMSGNPIYIITLKKRDYVNIGGRYGDRREWTVNEPIDGEKCWCVENEMGTIVTRRCGKVAIMGNCQSLYRGTRVLPGILHDGMAIEDRLRAIAASAKKFLLVLSPFYISDSIDICEPFDLFGVRPGTRKKLRQLKDFTEPGKIRDYIKALEKAADKHAHKQPRTIDPVKFALSVGDGALANYQPMTAAEAAPATRDELDLLLGYGIDTTAIKCSGEAQRQIARLRERERLGLATPTQLNFLLKLTKTDPSDPSKRVPLYGKEWLMGIKKNVAGALVGKNAERWR